MCSEGSILVGDQCSESEFGRPPSAQPIKGPGGRLKARPEDSAVPPSTRPSPPLPCCLSPPPFRLAHCCRTIERFCKACLDFDRHARALIERSNGAVPPGVHDQLHAACKALRECCPLAEAAGGGELFLRLAAAGNRILLESGTLQIEARLVSASAATGGGGGAGSASLASVALSRDLTQTAVREPGSAAAGMPAQQAAFLTAGLHLEAMSLVAWHLHVHAYPAAMRLLVGADVQQATFQRWLRAALAALQLNVQFGGDSGEPTCLCLLVVLQ